MLSAPRPEGAAGTGAAAGITHACGRGVRPASRSSKYACEMQPGPGPCLEPTPSLVSGAPCRDAVAMWRRQRRGSDPAAPCAPCTLPAFVTPPALIRPTACTRRTWWRRSALPRTSAGPWSTARPSCAPCAHPPARPGRPTSAARPTGVWPPWQPPPSRHRAAGACLICALAVCIHTLPHSTKPLARARPDRAGVSPPPPRPRLQHGPADGNVGDWPHRPGGDGPGARGASREPGPSPPPASQPRAPLTSSRPKSPPALPLPAAPHRTWRSTWRRRGSTSPSTTAAATRQTRRWRARRRRAWAPACTASTSSKTLWHRWSARGGCWVLGQLGGEHGLAALGRQRDCAACRPPLS